jgi:hypothetical protein
MHEATRTFCCRAGFLMCALLPTLAVGGWIVVRASPRYASIQERQWQHMLAATLGLAAKIERIEEPRPGAYVLHGVVLSDPDAPRNSRPLLKVERVEIAQRSTGLVLLASDGEVAGEQLPRLWNILHERLLRGPEIVTTPVSVSLSSVVLAGDKDPTRLTDVRLQLTSTAASARGTIEFRLDGSAGDPARLAVERLRGPESLGTRWMVNTGATPLPCSALAACIPQLAHLGDACTFHGMLDATTHDASYDATLAGTFQQLDLQQLVSQQLPQHHLTGSATLTITEARWRGGHLQMAAGGLHARGGEIGSSLWRDNALGLQLHPQLPRTQQRLDYGELAFGFEMQPEALRISGACLVPQAILTDREGVALVYESKSPHVQPIALVHALLPGGSRYEGRQLDYLIPVETPVRQAAAVGSNR